MNAIANEIKTEAEAIEAGYQRIMVIRYFDWFGQVWAMPGDAVAVRRILSTIEMGTPAGFWHMDGIYAEGGIWTMTEEADETFCTEE